MTTANKITIVRLLLIPVFVVLAVGYGDGVQHRSPDESLRWAAIAVFLIAATSDGLDGYVARHFHQTSKSGAILDAVADKGLLMAGLLTLTFCDWGYPLPWWLTALVITRDVVVVAGSIVLYRRNGDVHVRPRWTGKIATCFQIASVAWVMLQLRFVTPLVVIAPAGVFTLWSWIGYMTDGFRQAGWIGNDDASDSHAGTLAPLESLEP